ncbi:hypothetical protein CXG81DRAFT_17046 [Caulochytrium protostelioides]|uniref:Mediator of RNA polymerase II transcription subunit 18 n=1 Tax=Caulochytrium protostelioides TaxID=1555241 RepID=A0A4P9XD54_9FUNG|nr:hypothetical protein CXG81DRAFT_17046 [Caulochytrium protostelioides]|eukprot:RKP03424.1 hypothetical protein CXG81DRAFT_17046 [Caulochytrium protostelioides]
MAPLASPAQALKSGRAARHGLSAAAAHGASGGNALAAGEPAATQPTHPRQFLTLHGSVPDGPLFQKVIERLAGLCGAETAPTEALFEHVIVFRPSVATPFGAGTARHDDHLLRIVAPIFAADGKTFLPIAQRTWALRLLGTPDPSQRDQKHPNQRVVLSSEIRGNPFDYLTFLGYTFHFEYVRRGYAFSYNKVLIELYRCLKLRIRHQVSSAIEPESVEDAAKAAAAAAAVASNANGTPAAAAAAAAAAPRAASEAPYILEATLPVINHHEIPHAKDELSQLRAFMSGLVTLEPVDHVLLTNRIFYSN